MPNELITTLQGAATELFASALLLILVLVRGWLKAKFLLPIFNRFFDKPDHNPEEDTAMGRRISDAIAELKGKIVADRIMVIQFHNGEVFAAQNPIWKMSCTHETVRDGVSYEAKAMHAVPISQMVIEISALWNSTWAEWTKPGAVPVPGVTRYNCNGRCEKCAGEAKVVVITTEALGPSYMKDTLAAKGTLMALSSPLVVNGRVVGFLAVDYTATRPESEDAKTRLFEVCETAKKIGYYISQGVR